MFNECQEKPHVLFSLPLSFPLFAGKLLKFLRSLSSSESTAMETAKLLLSFYEIQYRVLHESVPHDPRASQSLPAIVVIYIRPCSKAP